MTRLPRLHELSTPARLLATWFLLTLATGFVAAQVNLRLTHADADGEPGLGFGDVVAAFHGRPGTSLLTSKIAPSGSMSKHVPRPQDRATITDWVRDGASEEGFEQVRKVLDRRCIRCHNPGGEMSATPFASSRAAGAQYDLVLPTTRPDTGMSYVRLARSSHAHLFGMGMLHALAGVVFLMTRAGALTKSIVISLPFAAMFIDIGSWWLTKFHASFAVGIVAGGALLGAAWALIVVWALWDLWSPVARAAKGTTA